MLTGVSINMLSKVKHGAIRGTKQFSTKASVPPRRTLSPNERAALRASRKQQAAQSMEAQSSSASKSAGGSSSAGKAISSSAVTAGKKPMDTRVVYGLGVGVPTVLLAWGIADETSPPAKFARMIGVTKQWDEFADQFARPIREKLLPDWPMPNVPQDMPCPHTLVLDLEDTLVSSSWDRKHGWRHAKRPGVDKFLAEMAQYYEVVLYSQSIDGVADPVVTSLDKNGCILHRLYKEACYYKKGIYMKDLSSLNRNMNKIILLDDQEEAAALNPLNLIKVKPYNNPKDRDDNVLERITPFLIEIAKESYDNIPELLRGFQGMDSDGIADEMERRVDQLREHRVRSSERGLGAFSGIGRREMPAPEMTPTKSRNRSSAGSQAPTAKDLVGDAPANSQSIGKGVSGWMQRRQKEQQEEQMRKMEYWNEVMLKKQKEKSAR